MNLVNRLFGVVSNKYMYILRKNSLIYIIFISIVASANAQFLIPESNRMVYNLNYDWKFVKSDVSNAYTTTFNDTGWKTVSLPHTYNDIDLFDTWVTGSGNYGWAGKTWYRKHFKLDESFSGRKVFVEFESIRQAGEFYINSY